MHSAHVGIGKAAARALLEAERRGTLLSLPPDLLRALQDSLDSRAAFSADAAGGWQAKVEALVRLAVLVSQDICTLLQQAQRRPDDGETTSLLGQSPVRRLHDSLAEALRFAKEASPRAPGLLVCLWLAADCLPRQSLLLLHARQLLHAAWAQNEAAAVHGWRVPPAPSSAAPSQGAAGNAPNRITLDTPNFIAAQRHVQDAACAVLSIVHEVLDTDPHEDVPPDLEDRALAALAGSGFVEHAAALALDLLEASSHNSTLESVVNPNDPNDPAAEPLLGALGGLFGGTQYGMQEALMAALMFGCAPLPRIHRQAHGAVTTRLFAMLGTCVLSRQHVPVLLACSIRSAATVAAAGRHSGSSGDTSDTGSIAAGSGSSGGGRAAGSSVGGIGGAGSGRCHTPLTPACVTAADDGSQHGSAPERAGRPAFDVVWKPCNVLPQSDAVLLSMDYTRSAGLELTDSMRHMLHGPALQLLQGVRVLAALQQARPGCLERCGILLDGQSEDMVQALMCGAWQQVDGPQELQPLLCCGSSWSIWLQSMLALRATAVTPKSHVGPLSSSVAVVAAARQLARRPHAPQWQPQGGPGSHAPVAPLAYSPAAVLRLALCAADVLQESRWDADRGAQRWPMPSQFYNEVLSVLDCACGALEVRRFH